MPSAALWRVALLAVLTLAALASRTAMPVDETRYLAVAWEMWQRGDFLVPWRNGEAYSHKPPLLFWLIHAGWAAFGVNDLWPRLIAPICALASLSATRRIAAELWPDAPWRAERSAWILLGSLLFALFAGMLMFDMLLAACVALGVLGLVVASNGRARGFALLAAAIGLGVLAKGPVALLHLMPAALLAPWWAGRKAARWPRWYAGIALALLGGAAVALAWAVPAGLRGGDEYRNAIFWGQTAGRVTDAFAHQRPFWWYLPLLPVVAAPWLVWRPFWRGLRAVPALADRGMRLALLLAVGTLAAFSAVSGKQVHYLVPALPAFALIVAGALDGPQRHGRPWLAAAGLALIGLAVLALPYVNLPPPLAPLAGIAPAWAAPFVALGAWLAWKPRSPGRQVPRMAAAAVLSLAAAHLAFVRPLAPAYDVGPIAREIAEVQSAGRAVGHAGVYHAQYQFAGRLRQPLTPLVTQRDSETWIDANPDGAIVLYFRPPFDPAPLGPIAVQPFRGRVAALFDARHAHAPLAVAASEDAPYTEPDVGAHRLPQVPR